MQEMQKKSVTEYDEMANLITSLKEKSVQVLLFFTSEMCYHAATVYDTRFLFTRK